MPTDPPDPIQLAVVRGAGVQIRSGRTAIEVSHPELTRAKEAGQNRNGDLGRHFAFHVWRGAEEAAWP